VAVDDTGTIVGSVVVRPDGELARLHVHPERWRCGIGQALHDAAGDRARSLWVIDRNERARRFYERNGWVLDPTERQGNEVRYRRYDR
jgi:GNAT superfamily N-acetyltransferase